MVIVLRFFHDLDQDAIVAEIGYSQMHVSRLLRRGLGCMRTTPRPLSSPLQQLSQQIDHQEIVVANASSPIWPGRGDSNPLTRRLGVDVSTSAHPEAA